MEENYSDKLQEKGRVSDAIKTRDNSILITIVANALTSFMFGYNFVLLLPFDLSILTLSMNGILGGLIVTGMSDYMAHAWDKTLLRGSDNREQSGVAVFGYRFSMTCSVSMTVVFLIYTMGIVTDTEAWLTLGKYLVPIMITSQMLLWQSFKRKSTDYKSSKLKADANAELQKEIMDLKSKVAEDAMNSVRVNLKCR